MRMTPLSEGGSRAVADALGVNLERLIFRPAVSFFTAAISCGIRTSGVASSLMSAAGSGAYLYTSLLHNLFPQNTRIVLGYQGSGDIWLAMERREVDANCNVWAGLKAQRPDWFRDKKATVLVQFSEHPHPDLPDTPLVSDITHSDKQRRALAFLVSAEAIARPIVAPPGLTAERTTALRRAFGAAMVDPKMREIADKAQMELGPVNGEQAQEIATHIAATDADILATVRDLVQTH